MDSTRVTDHNIPVRDLERRREALMPEIERLSNVDKISPEDDKRLAGLVTEVRDINAKLQIAEGIERGRVSALPGVGGAYVRNEPRTYDQHTAKEGRSFFADAFNAQARGDVMAQERLTRHMREVAVEHRDLATGDLNGLIPPGYLLDQAAEYARAMRPFADSLPTLELPRSGMSFVIPKSTTGTSTAVQTTQNVAVSETNMVTTDLTVAVVSIAGQQDVSRQIFERSSETVPADMLIMRDLLADYATRLDQRLLIGDGTNGDHKGILNATGIATQTWTGTTVASFMSKLAGAVNEVTTNRYAPPTTIIMSPRRWNWLLAASDPDGRPLVVPSPGTASNPVGTGGVGYGVVGTLQGLPVITTANMPTNLGTSTNEDRVIVTRLEDHVLWEPRNGAGAFVFQSVAAPQTVRLAVFGYSAATFERYPSATCVMVGTGLVPPAF